MITACPLCGALPSETIWVSEAAPVFQLLGKGETPVAGDFASLVIVRCGACGHLYNRAFSPELADRMYGGDVLSNVPVHVSMSRNLEEIAGWIGRDHYAGKRVIEVGAGSGHLARILAHWARAVIVFEPSRGLRPDMLPEENITLIRNAFEADTVEEPADLIVCRQVLEHVAEPLALLKEIRAALSSDGYLYLEVPRAEYIEEHAALFDLHCAHVQYFHEANLLRLAALAGFRAERQWRLKNGHDFGMLLRPSAERSAGEESVRPLMSHDVAARLERRRSRGREFLAGLNGRIGLYGATWQGVAFLDTFQRDRGFAATIDDNNDYVGCVLYSRVQVIPVVELTRETIETLDHVIITAYLHDRVIAEKLKNYGFAGRIFTLRTDGDGITNRAF